MKQRMTPIKEKSDLQKRCIKVIGEKADGNVAVWQSMTLAQLALGCCNKQLHDIINSGKPYKQYRRIRLEEE